MLPTAIRVSALIAPHFKPAGEILTVEPFGSGNVNDTFLVHLDIPASDGNHFILQRLNTQVFPDPAAVMGNMRRCTEAMAIALQQNPLDRRWEIPHILPHESGADFYTDEQGQVWRAIAFIAGTTIDHITTPHQAQELGYGLGQFQSLIQTIPPQDLADTLPGFHITPRYLAQYQAAIATATIPNSPEVRHCQGWISDRASTVGILETAKAKGELTLRPIHGDPKVNNLLLDPETGQAVTMVDLDTVKPGLIHYDVGDCLRSGCNPLGEETADWEKVVFDCDRAEIILKAYLDLARPFLTPQDGAYLYTGIRLITLELGLRFFTDYLAGNVYFHVNDPEHNLRRALVQFQLCASIEAQASRLESLIQSLFNPSQFKVIS